MPEDENKTEMVNNQQAAETEAPAAQGDAAEKVTIAKAELEAMQAALKKANQEAAARRKELERAAAEQKAKEQAEMTELQKAQAKAAELEAELQYAETKRQKARDCRKGGTSPRAGAAPGWGNGRGTGTGREGDPGQPAEACRAEHRRNCTGRKRAARGNASRTARALGFRR